MRVFSKKLWGCHQMFRKESKPIDCVCLRIIKRRKEKYSSTFKPPVRQTSELWCACILYTLTLLVLCFSAGVLKFFEYKLQGESLKTLVGRVAGLKPKMFQRAGQAFEGPGAECIWNTWAPKIPKNNEPGIWNRKGVNSRTRPAVQIAPALRRALQFPFP